MLDSSVRLASAFPLLVAFATGQCPPEWLAANTYPGTNGLVRAIARWDPDGPGPLTERIVVGGSFSAAGGVDAPNVASWDPATSAWSALGAGLPGIQGSHVYALLGLPSGALLAGGDMPAGALASPGVAIWSGGAWQALGSLQGQTGIELGGFGAALALRANGDVLAAGRRGVARWSGVAWQTIGMTDFNGTVRALAVLPNGELVAGGQFSSLGGATTSHVARWDGVAWHAMGNGLPGVVGSLSVLATGEVVATGTGVGVNSFRVMRWDGAAWTSLGGGFDGDVQSSAVLDNGDLVVGGIFAVPGSRIARWDGTAWYAMGSGADNAVVALRALPGGEVVAGGNFRHVDGAGCGFVGRWNGNWSALGPGLDEQVRDFEPLPNGDIVIGGDFTHAGAVDARRVARWSGGAWHALGSGVAGTVPVVRAIEVLANGDVVVGGSFDTAGGQAAPQLARFDGAQWHAMGTSPGLGTVNTLLELPDGTLLVGGNFRINGTLTYLARWSPTGWTLLPAAPNQPVHTAILLANGDLLISGSFTMVGSTPANGIARGDGTAWTALGAGLGGVATVPCLAEMPGGALVVAGSFTTAGGAAIPTIAQWNGAQWAPLGSQPFAQVRAFAKLPNGDLAVGGAFTSFPPPAHVARWDGAVWSTLGTVHGSVTGGSTGSSPVVQSLAMLPTGDLAVSGWFLGVGGTVVSPYLALLAPTCRAAVASYGSGCVGSGGVNTLAATSGPWLESRFTSRATGLAPGSLGVAVWAFSQMQLPLPLVHPAGQQGCDLLVDDQILIDFAVVSGAMSASIAIPLDPNIVGATFYHQVIGIELNALADITALTSTNGLAAVVGWF